MTSNEVVNIFKGIVSSKRNPYTFDEEMKTFYDDAHEIEWQIRSTIDGSFHKILMCFCDDKTPTYIELYLSEFNNDIYELIYYAIEDGVEELTYKTFLK